LVANATCLPRSLLLVVEPHSMSIVPFCSSGIRLADVTACSPTLRSARPVAFFTSSTIFWQISKPKPTGWALSSRYEKGIDDSR
jgi:hypothetical protein